MSQPSSSSSSSPLAVWIINQPWLPDLNLKMKLGEGPYYEASTHSVRWVDIFGHKIYWASLKPLGSGSGSTNGDGLVDSVRSVDVDDAVGVTADIHGDDKHILAAAKYGFALVDKRSGEMRYLKRVYDGDAGKAERMRFNDGAVDKRGRFWAGSMTDNVKYDVKQEGTVFRLDALASNMTGPESVAVSRQIESVMIPNGIGWSPVKDGVMYFTDSMTRTIWEYDYDDVSGSVSNRRPWFVLEGSVSIPASSSSSSEPSEPEIFTFYKTMAPDGFQFDVEGNLWTAIWGAGMVLRIADLGDKRVITGVVRVPARCSSCCRFVPGGGMVITSASEEDPAKFGDGGPGAGALFWVNVGVEGAETWSFGRRGPREERSRI